VRRALLVSCRRADPAVLPRVLPNGMRLMGDRLPMPLTRR
jgi:hypothetical protein